MDYHVCFYEDGVFSTLVGGPVPTLDEAIKQMEKLAIGLKAEEVPGCLGYKFDRAGTTCALVVTDMFGFPIKDA